MESFWEKGGIVRMCEKIRFCCEQLNQNKKMKIWIYLFLLLVSVLTVLLTSTFTSVLYPNVYGQDCAAFMKVGRAVLRGYVPYRDIYDIKGPFLWFVETFAQAILPGKGGIFLLELFLFNLITFLTYACARLYLNPVKSLGVTLVSTIFWIAFKDFGNTVEELSAPFAMIVVYGAMKAVSNKQFPKNTYYFLMGFAASCVFLIRVPNCIVIFSCFLFLMAWEFAVTKSICQMCKRSLWTLLGFLLPIAVFSIYYATKNAFWDMIDAVFLFSMSYNVFNKGGKLVFLKLLGFIFPLAAALYSATKRNYTLLSCFSIVLNAMILCLYGIMGLTHGHYLGLGAPCLVVGMIHTFLTAAATHTHTHTHTHTRRAAKYRKLIVLMLFFVCNIFYVYQAAFYTAYDIRRFFVENKAEQSRFAFAEEVRARIENNHADEVYTYDTSPDIIYLCGCESRSKFFCWQTSWSRDFDMKERIYEDFLQGHNYWVIAPAQFTEKFDERIVNEIVQNYELIYKDKDNALYQLKEVHK